MEIKKTETGSFLVGDNEVSADAFNAIQKSARSDANKATSEGLAGIADQLNSLTDNPVLKDGQTMNDKFSALGDVLKTLTTEVQSFRETGKKPDQPKTELDMKKEMADLKESTKKEISDEHNVIFIKDVKNQIRAKLIENGLRDNYLNMVDSLIDTRFKIENNKGEAIFSDRDGDVMSGGIAERVSEIAKAFPEILQTPKKSWADNMLTGQTKEEISKLNVREKFVLGASSLGKQAV